MRFSAILVPLVTAVIAVQAAAVGNNVTPRSAGGGAKSLTERAFTGTGCTCLGFFYRHTSYWNYANIALFRPNTHGNAGWCWQDGAMTQNFANLVTAAVSTQTVTPAFNGTWGRTWCNINCGTTSTCPTSMCVTRLIDTFTNAGAPTYYSDCTWPTSNFIPTNCDCSFQCTNGYVACGRQCINPATQTCVSGLPQTNRKRDVNRPPGVGYCPDGLLGCPLPGGGYECIDSNRDLEACGGCPSYSVGDNSTLSGVDCSAIDGVHDVSCVAGRCFIESCGRDYALVAGKCQYAPRTRRGYSRR